MTVIASGLYHLCQNERNSYFMVYAFIYMCICVCLINELKILFCCGLLVAK